MCIVSFDQSTRRSGYAVFEDGKYIESGVIDMKNSELETDRRSFEMAKEIWKIIKKYRPNEIIIENIQQQSSPKTVIILARLAGMIIGYAEAHNIHVNILSPSEWRSALKFKQGSGVKRKELKEQSINYVKDKYGLDVSEDECEAICINDAARIKYFTEIDEEDLWGFN